MNTSDDDILQFIAASFPSVWALELVLVLRRERRLWMIAEMVDALRASELVVSRALEALVAAGLASLEGGGAVYLPVTSNADKSVDGAVQLYRRRPNAVRRAIIAASTSSAAAFANAFRVRRGKDD